MIPHCFYHPQQIIIGICLQTNCILPLCKQCMDIHNIQFPSGDHISTPLNYAKDIAISQINSQQQSKIQQLNQLNIKFNQFKVQIYKTIQQSFNHIEKKKKQLTNKYQQTIKNYKTKIQKIKVNNLKQLIKHYQTDDSIIPPSLNFSYNINTEQLKNIIIQSFQTSQQTKKNQQTKDPNMCNLIKNISFNSLIDQTAQFGKKQTKDLSDSKKQNTQNSQQITLSKKKTLKRGIFVTSSPSHMKISQRHGSIQARTSHQLKQQKFNRQTINKYSTNKLTSKFTNNKHQIININSLNQSLSSQFQQNPQVSSINTSVLKQMIGSKQSSPQKQKSQFISQSSKKGKNWKEVINKCIIIPTSNNNTFQVIKPSNQDNNFQCLSPQKVRQLIMKKRTNKMSQSSICNIQNLQPKKSTQQLNSNEKLTRIIQE